VGPGDGEEVFPVAVALGAGAAPAESVAPALLALMEPMPPRRVPPVTAATVVPGQALVDRAAGAEPAVMPA
jgi:hypothetical protein